MVVLNITQFLLFLIPDKEIKLSRLMELRYPYLTSLSNEFVISSILCWPWVLLEMPSVTDCVNFHPSSIAVPLIGSRYDENKSCVEPRLLRIHLNSLGSTISKLKKKNLKSFQGFLVSLFCVIFPYHVKVTMLLKKRIIGLFLKTKYELYDCFSLGQRMLWKLWPIVSWKM